MKNFKSIICIMLVLCTLSVCSCSGRKKVTVIQNNDKAPEQKKTVESVENTSNGHDYSQDITVEFGDESLILRSPTNEYAIPYEKIEEYTYMTEWNFQSDNLMEGMESECEIYGKMKTEADEEYVMCIYKTTPVYIAIYFGGTQYVFNLDSATATKNCYSELKEKMG